MKSITGKALPFVVSIGYLLWLSVFLLPGEFLTSILGNARWGFVATFYLCPIFGIVGILLSVGLKKWKWTFFSSLLIFSSLISVFIGNIVELFTTYK